MIRTVSLELVRKGPPHNQLLSPLTSYLAICGNHEPEEVQLPFEHAALLRKLKNLRYDGLATDLDADVLDLRRSLIGMLRSIHALERQLTAAQDADLVVLELVLSAAELSLIPFELVFRPGTPTRELCGTDVVILRRTRRVPAARIRWPHRPRILMVYAQPRRKVPFADHALALRECLDPFLAHVTGDGDPSELRKYLAVVEGASLSNIRETCARYVFTHVHILAHGVQFDNGQKFGLELQHPTRPGEIDVVTGDRLVGALGAGRNGLPACVTVAACDSGNQGDVVFTGSSVAHELHEGGVSLVVASQFPLSFDGSVALTRSLYDALLGVHDPQSALQRTRRELHARSARGVGSVDWASVIAYGALPVELDKQLVDAKLMYKRRIIDSALALIDPYVETGKDGGGPKVPTTADYERVENRLVAALAERGRVTRTAAWHEACAHAYLRWAEALWWQGGGTMDGVRAFALSESFGPIEDGEALAPASNSDAKGMLRRSRDAFREQHARDGSAIAYTRALACVAFLGQRIGWSEWTLAFGLTELRRRSARKASDRERAHDLALIELSLLLELVSEEAYPESLAEGESAGAGRLADMAGWVTMSRQRLGASLGAEPYERLRILLEEGNPESYAFYAFYRQLLRYLTFLPELTSDTTRIKRFRVLLDEYGVRQTWTAITEWIERPGGFEVEVSEPS